MFWIRKVYFIEKEEKVERRPKNCGNVHVRKELSTLCQPITDFDRFHIPQQQNKNS